MHFQGCVSSCTLPRGHPVCGLRQTRKYKMHHRRGFKAAEVPFCKREAHLATMFSKKRGENLGFGRKCIQGGRATRSCRRRFRYRIYRLSVGFINRKHTKHAAHSNLRFNGAMFFLLDMISLQRRFTLSWKNTQGGLYLNKSRLVSTQVARNTFSDL